MVLIHPQKEDGVLTRPGLTYTSISDSPTATRIRNADAGEHESCRPQPVRRKGRHSHMHEIQLLVSTWADRWKDEFVIVPAFDCAHMCLHVDDTAKAIRLGHRLFFLCILMFRHFDLRPQK